MSTIKAELQKVHKLPLIKRVWLYLKDNPGCTAVTLGSVLKETPNSTSSVLGILHSRSMVTRKQTTRRDGKQQYEYSIPSKYTEYELLPMPPKKPKIAPVEVNPVPVEADAAKPAAEAKSSSVIDLDNVTIAEARRIYLMLKKMFGHEKL